MSSRKIRQLVAEALWQESATLLPRVCKRYGLADGGTDEAFRSKKMYVLSRLEEIPDSTLFEVAKKVLVDYPTQDLKNELTKTQKLPSVSNAEIHKQIKILGEEHISEIWNTALERIDSKPEGAITLAITMIDSTCKTILDDLNIPYTDRDEIHQLYDKVAKALNLSPTQHQEEVFKNILGNCKSIVFCLANIRNKLSEAHGKGKNPTRPLPRHAFLAVSLAGTMSTFLIRTHIEKKVAS